MHAPEALQMAGKPGLSVICIRHFAATTKRQVNGAAVLDFCDHSASRNLGRSNCKRLGCPFHRAAIEFAHRQVLRAIFQAVQVATDYCFLENVDSFKGSIYCFGVMTSSAKSFKGLNCCFSWSAVCLQRINASSV